MIRFKINQKRKSNIIELYNIYKIMKERIPNFNLSFIKYYWLHSIIKKLETIYVPIEDEPIIILNLFKTSKKDLQIKHYLIDTHEKCKYMIKHFFQRFNEEKRIEGINRLYFYTDKKNVTQIDFFINKLKYEENASYSFRNTIVEKGNIILLEKYLNNDT